jgi:ariadne-1
MDSEDDMMDANDVESVDDDFYSGDMEDDYYSDGVYYDNDDDDVNDDDDGPDYDFMAEAVDDPDDLSFRSQVIFLFGFFFVILVINFAALNLLC